MGLPNSSAIAELICRREAEIRDTYLVEFKSTARESWRKMEVSSGRATTHLHLHVDTSTLALHTTHIHFTSHFAWHGKGVLGGSREEHGIALAWL